MVDPFQQFQALPGQIARKSKGARREDIEDATQEGLLCLWVNREQFSDRHGAKPRTLAYQFARRGVVDHFRAQMGRNGSKLACIENADTLYHPDGRPKDFVGTTHEDIRAQLDRPFVSACLREYVDRLPDRERSVVIMYFWESMTYQEIGEVFGVTRARIGQIMIKALGRLKKWVSNSDLSR